MLGEKITLIKKLQFAASKLFKNRTVHQRESTQMQLGPIWGKRLGVEEGEATGEALPA